MWVVVHLVVWTGLGATVPLRDVFDSAALTIHEEADGDMVMNSCLYIDAIARTVTVSARRTTKRWRKNKTTFKNVINSVHRLSV